ncbi:immunoglobulin iota chain-like [Acipenser oxyrinchus oxyrinchus]|nr:immunoglobulin iota chain-like [Acipenser oxyrinchus oxyrinchus]
MYLCLYLFSLNVFLGLTLQDKVTQSPASIFAREGEDRIVSCTYELTISGGTQYLQWYRQDTNSAPKYIIQTYKTGSETKQNKANENEDRLSTSLNTSVKFTSLKITNLRLNDSAVYYCALKATAMQFIQEAYQKPGVISEQLSVIIYTHQCTAVQPTLLYTLEEIIVIHKTFKK